MKQIVRHMELWLTGLGMLLILLIPMIVAASPAAYWHIAAVTATTIGILHGLIFWAIRQRQRWVRQATIFEISRMLQDRIKNQLTVILMNVQYQNEDLDYDPDCINDIYASVAAVTQLLDTLSEESLRRWSASAQAALKELDDTEMRSYRSH